MTSFITSDYVREQTKLVDVPLVIADRRYTILATSSIFLKKHRLVPCSSKLSTSQKKVTLQQVGSVHKVASKDNVHII